MAIRGLGEFIADLQSRGRYTFTRKEAADFHNGSWPAVKKSLQRLAAKGKIVPVHRGFYVIVPLEYRKRGILPPEWFINDLMGFLGVQYYVGLLSAAAIHGAAHQQPQEFQVVVASSIRDIELSSLHIRFFKKEHLSSIPTAQTKTGTGYISVSSPGSTAIDLVAYERRIGGLSRVVTILQELQDRLDPAGLVEAAMAEQSLAPIQRLGFILEKMGQGNLVSELRKWVASKSPRPTPLQTGSSPKGSQRDANWNVIQNAELEGDL
jgi:predicted transcriptional regulator of viral defense system